MAWPSKDPEDYYERRRWDVAPPRWLARLRGEPPVDPVPAPVQLAATVPAFIAGGVIAELAGWDALLVAGWSAAVARSLLQVVWRQRRRHAEAGWAAVASSRRR